MNKVNVKIDAPPPPEDRVTVEMSLTEARAVRAVLAKHRSTVEVYTFEVYRALDDELQKLSRR